MSDTKLIVTKDKLDKLATSISTKSGVSTPLTIAQMKAAVDGLVCGTITQDENGYLVISDEGDSTQRYSLEEICTNEFVEGDVIFSGTKLRSGLFYTNTKITSFTGNNVTNAMGDSWGSMANVHTFYGCTNLESVSMTSLKDLYHTDYIFSGCTKLKTANLDYMNMTRLGTGVFNNCSALEKTTFVLPKVTSNVYGSFITNNANLTAFDIGGLASSVGNIAASAFTNCSNLNKIIIRDSSIRTLGNISAFTGTPFASDGSGGTLYVPSSLVSTYQSATNWSTILGYANNSITSIEGSQYENYYADGTAVSS